MEGNFGWDCIRRFGGLAVKTPLASLFWLCRTLKMIARIQPQLV
nr:hypothetical protein [uncultured Prevotella sp.]